MDRLEIGGATIVLLQGDITEQDVDAIVNAANSRLMGGGGVDGAIHRAGGATILEACQQIRETDYPDGLPTGETVVTPAGKLPARHVIHTVGPRYRDGRHNEDDLLADAYWNSLLRAVELGCRSIAFPSISTGAYGYPIKDAAAVALTMAADFLYDHPDELAEVRFVLFSDADLGTFRDALSTVEADLRESED
jgi:O-acetyl-ADP-ribose deacetylase (regulator of RNase III)